MLWHSINVCQTHKTINSQLCFKNLLITSLDKYFCIISKYKTTRQQYHYIRCNSKSGHCKQCVYGVKCWAFSHLEDDYIFQNIRFSWYNLTWYSFTSLINKVRSRCEMPENKQTLKSVVKKNWWIKIITWSQRKIVFHLVSVWPCIWPLVLGFETSTPEILISQVVIMNEISLAEKIRSKE